MYASLSAYDYGLLLPFCFAATSSKVIIVSDVNRSEEQIPEQGNLFQQKNHGHF